MSPTSKKLLLSSHDRIDRIERLRTHGVNLDQLHSSLKSEVIGDFLWHKHPRKRILRVAQSFRAALTLQHLRPENPSPDLLALVEKRVLHVGMAPRSVDATIRLYRLTQKVFSLLWYQVFRMLPLEGDEGEETRITALNCNAVFEFAERRDINWELSQHDFRAEIAFELETRSPDDIDFTSLFNTPAFSDFWKLVNAYPRHAWHQKPAVVTRITDYLSWKKASILESVLQAKFEEHGVETREDSYLIDQFREGNIFCDPEQIVANVQLRATLQEKCSDPGYLMRLQDKYETLLEHEVFVA
ncbi:hypothetical protein HDU96_000001, partial [Phlyctochytrium bullatum]